ncbi:hypothetical protein [Candidatus Galacturonibacter soehngenii]|uniref:Uncharacterized protein n=1 Tax=Candidatus Galacturonatibacter soehngenii TaxID=2307010 RepID=A0A7V7QIU0_9FIRM|nr:hypothetical protein [Candidatus Galacturonibacter soehngenii]KAB1436581.1 hypothetical protein F7O84_14570 [Candidatus Galacturonibacter soehngenii]
MEITTHGLKKPGGDDFYNIQDHNDNTDIIEQHLSDTDIHVNSQEIAQITEVETLAQIDEYDTIISVWGKVKKVISTLIEHISSVATGSTLGHIKIGTGLQMNSGTASVKLTDSVSTDDSTTALSAAGGKKINDSLNKIGVVYAKRFLNLSIPIPTTWTPLTDTVTISESGIYLISINSMWIVPNSTTRFTIRAFINGSEQPNLSCEAPVQQPFVSTSITAPITLVAGSTVDVRGYVTPAIPSVENNNNLSLTITRIK